MHSCRVAKRHRGSGADDGHRVQVSLTLLTRPLTHSLTGAHWWGVVHDGLFTSLVATTETLALIPLVAGQSPTLLLRMLARDTSQMNQASCRWLLLRPSPVPPEQVREPACKWYI